MTLTRDAKKYIIFGCVFGALAITFALLYYFNVISTLNLFTCVTYVVYFAGLALFYNGGLAREKGNRATSIASYLCATVFVVAAAVLLIYGFATDNISFLN